MPTKENKSIKLLLFKLHDSTTIHKQPPNSLVRWHHYMAIIVLPLVTRWWCPVAEHHGERRETRTADHTGPASPPTLAAVCPVCLILVSLSLQSKTRNWLSKCHGQSCQWWYIIYMFRHICFPSHLPKTKRNNMYYVLVVSTWENLKIELAQNKNISWEICF